MTELLDGLIAPDRWSISWDLTSTPQSISYTNAKGELQNHISGKIDMRYLERKIAQFKCAHFYTQASLFRMETTQ